MMYFYKIIVLKCNMDIFWAIRSGIFLVAGLLVILFPKQIGKFQIYGLEKLHIKYKSESWPKTNLRIGIIFIIISLILFVWSIII